MSTSTVVGIESRVLNEGYGSGAWHGADLKAALADVAPALAYWRPATGRHNIAEIALHHAYFVRAVRTQISGRSAEPFVLDGEDWFDLTNETTLSWPKIQATVEAEHRSLSASQISKRASWHRHSRRLSTSTWCLASPVTRFITRVRFS